MAESTTNKKNNPKTSICIYIFNPRKKNHTYILLALCSSQSSLTFVNSRFWLWPLSPGSSPFPAHPPCSLSISPALGPFWGLRPAPQPLCCSSHRARPLLSRPTSSRHLLLRLQTSLSPGSLPDSMGVRILCSMLYFKPGVFCH